MIGRVTMNLSHYFLCETVVENFFGFNRNFRWQCRNSSARSYSRVIFTKANVGTMYSAILCTIGKEQQRGNSRYFCHFMVIDLAKSIHLLANETVF